MYHPALKHDGLNINSIYILPITSFMKTLTYTLDRKGFRPHKRIKIRSCKYLNNIIEQDHRNIMRITNLILGFKNFHYAQATLKRIELMAMLREAAPKKGQQRYSSQSAARPANEFYALAG